MRVVSALTWVAALGLLAAPAFAQSMEERGRAVFDRHKAAVVTVQLVLKMKYGGRDSESKIDVTGAVMTPGGLTVVSLSSTDPTAIMRSLASGEGGDFDMQSEVSDLRILLEDGTEIPAQIVLRDAELDLAYVQPVEAPAAPLPHIDFAAPGTAQLLDTVVALNRLGRVANRVYSASFERVEAIVQRPRTFYIPGSDPTHSAQGSPVFTLDGDIVGLIVMRAIRNTGGGGRMFGGNDSVMAIILPAADILEGAKQVPGFGATE